MARTRSAAISIRTTRSVDPKTSTAIACSHVVIGPYWLKTSRWITSPSATAIAGAICAPSWYGSGSIRAALRNTAAETAVTPTTAARSPRRRRQDTGITGRPFSERVGARWHAAWLATLRRLTVGQVGRQRFGLGGVRIHQADVPREVRVDEHSQVSAGDVLHLHAPHQVLEVLALVVEHLDQGLTLVDRDDRGLLQPQVVPAELVWRDGQGVPVVPAPRCKEVVDKRAKDHRGEHLVPVTRPENGVGEVDLIRDSPDHPLALDPVLPEVSRLHLQLVVLDEHRVGKPVRGDEIRASEVPDEDRLRVDAEVVLRCTELPEGQLDDLLVDVAGPVSVQWFRDQVIAEFVLAEDRDGR